MVRPLFIELPQSQSQKGVDEVLDGSLRLIDICATSLDVLVQSKERLLDIQSVLRRRCNGGLNFTNEFSEYIKTRKLVKRVVKKCLKDIQEVEKINEANATESKLKDVQSVTVDVFKSLLSYIGGSQKSNWSFSKFVHAKKAEKETASISAFDTVDSTVELSQLIKLESEIQVIEQDLECLFRHLVKTRATLLNGESNDTWSWFLDCIRQYVTKRDDLCVIFDRHKGILHAMNRVGKAWEEPYAFYRFCKRHLASNVLKKFKIIAVKNLFGKASEQTKIRKYNYYMKRLKEYDEDAYKYLVKGSIPERQWTLLYDGGHKYGVKTTNMSETFNSVM
ncbi:uncharacterized protein LOC130799251 [Amaranthus tricolor]|uniref:uncharacterized protein LOC130799251 n=1 Tax=Amaranthus tricolor TaxID=29722 RepID=UPI00258865D6|nr:uncharacterized protein LOC130799251 [Amaranthus tricolor]